MNRNSTNVPDLCRVPSHRYYSTVHRQSISTESVTKMKGETGERFLVGCDMSGPFLSNVSGDSYTYISLGTAGLVH